MSEPPQASFLQPPAVAVVRVRARLRLGVRVRVAVVRYWPAAI